MAAVGRCCNVGSSDAFTSPASAHVWWSSATQLHRQDEESSGGRYVQPHAALPGRRWVIGLFWCWHSNILVPYLNYLVTFILSLIACFFQKSLKNGSVLDGVIQFLMYTSATISFFRDYRPVHDSRLQALREILKESGESSSAKSPTLPPQKCMDDVQNMLITFPELCRQYLTDFPDGCVVPSRVNSDLIENHFCQTRGLHNGNMTNPY